MQSVTNDHSQTIEQTTPLVISAEMIAYSVLIILALILRLASLGSVPMTDAEATQALSAYHAVDNMAAGVPQAASSVVIFWLQQISFTFFGGTEFAARLPGVIGGIVLILMPLTMRQRLGREITFLIALVLAVSPIAFTAARLADSSIWTMVFAIGVLSALWHYWNFPLRENALTLAIFLAGMLFLSGATGLLLLVILLLAIIVTVFWMVSTAPDDRDTIGDDVFQQVRSYITALPILSMLAMMAGITFIIATGFLSETNGFNIVAESLRLALQGIIERANPEAPNLYAIMSLLVYEPILVVLGVLSAIMMLNSQSDTAIDRFVIAWAIVGFAILLIYQGTTAAHALILVIPLVYLSARLIAELLINYMPSFLSLESYSSDNPDDYVWIKWTVALVVFAGFLMLSLYLATVGRALLAHSGAFLATDQQTILLYARIGWFVIMVVLLIVLYFLFASIWGNRNVLQGYGLGTFAFMILIGIGTGWNTAVVNVSNPAELWYQTGIPADAAQLRQTLFDVSRRDTRGFPAINMVILRDEAAGITGDGLIAWMVRDFDNARFVDSIADVRQEEIIILPQLEEDPDLGGSYVGQQFIIREHWSRGQLTALDWVSWYTQRKTRSYDLPQDKTVLWLRIDVYDGIPASQRP